MVGCPIRFLVEIFCSAGRWGIIEVNWFSIGTAVGDKYAGKPPASLPDRPPG